MRGRRSYPSAKHSILLQKHSQRGLMCIKLKLNIIFFDFTSFTTCMNYLFSKYRFLSELGRHNYVTPTSYLELIAAFRLLLTQKRDTVMNAKQRYISGLEKLDFAESQVYLS